MELYAPYAVLVLSFAVELLIYLMLPSALKQARVLSYVGILVVTFSAATIVILSPNAASLLLVFVCLFRLLNIARVAVGRMNALELTRRFSRSALVLAAASLPVIGLVVTETSVDFSLILLWIAAFFALLSLTNTLLVVVQRPKKTVEEKTEKLPTVSICIPARNETPELADCIESILTSTYHKLEILVLDDCSHDKTPAVIKEYAHQGVRFISGEQPDGDWLAKNQAMEKLAYESSGDVLVFCGVDVRFKPDTVTRLVAELDGGLDMLGILPFRDDAHESSVFIQPLRYWWEISVPRPFFGRPPILSTCWAIRRSALKKIGGFASFRRSVQPEAHFAKRLKKSYKFLISGNRLGAVSVKPPKAQFDTAIRTRYPQTKRRLESVMLLLLLESVVFLLPIIMVVVSLVSGIVSTSTWIAAVALIFLVLTNTIITALTVKRSWPLGLVTLPVLLFEEWLVLIRSMLAYEFGAVMWKERNICLPLYQVEKSLPKV